MSFLDDLVIVAAVVVAMAILTLFVVFATVLVAAIFAAAVFRVVLFVLIVFHDLFSLIKMEGRTSLKIRAIIRVPLQKANEARRSLALLCTKGRFSMPFQKRGRIRIHCIPKAWANRIDTACLCVRCRVNIGK